MAVQGGEELPVAVLDPIAKDVAAQVEHHQSPPPSARMMMIDPAPEPEEPSEDDRFSRGPGDQGDDRVNREADRERPPRPVFDGLADPLLLHHEFLERDVVLHIPGESGEDGRRRREDEQPPFESTRAVKARTHGADGGGVVVPGREIGRVERPPRPRKDVPAEWRELAPRSQNTCSG